MNIRQLEIFVSVVDCGSFTGAAKALNMAQPAVSIAVRRLEESLNTHLLNRGERTLPTAEGEVLLKHARQLLVDILSARQHVEELNDLESGEVRFSTTAMLGSYFFLPLIAGFRKCYPGISLRVLNEGTHGAHQLLEQRANDMAVVNLDDLPDGIETVPLTRQEVVVCVSRNHPLAGRSKISFVELSKQPLVLYRENYALRRLVDSLSEHHQVNPNIVMETDLLGMIEGLVRAGEGVSICLRAMTDSEPELVGISLDEPLWLPLGLAWKRGQYLSAANRAFLEYLAETQ